MKKILSFSIISIISVSLNAQELISFQKTKRPNEAKVQLRYLHNDLKISDLSNSYGYYSAIEIQPTNHSYYGDLQILKGEETIVKKYDPNFKSDQGFTEVQGYIFQNDKFSVLNVANNNEIVAQYIQEYDYTLKKLGKPIKVIESKIKIDGKSSGLIKTTPFIFSDIYYNKKNKTSLLKLIVTNSSSKSYITLNVLDEYFQIKSTLTMTAENNTNRFRLAAHRILDNGEVIALIEKSDSEYVLGYELVHLSDNNEHIIEQILPAKKQIISTSISKNSVDDNLIVSFLSTGEKKNQTKEL